MKIFISIFFFLNSILFVNAQGAWDINYISIDSLNNNLIGNEIRLDFKSSNSDTINGSISLLKIRKLLFKRDTVILEVDGKKKEYIENWKFYVDHGLLRDQTLKVKNKSQIIKEQFIKSINDSTIVVKMNFYKPEQCKSKKMMLSSSKLVTIDKQLVKGVLFRRNE